MPLRAAAAAAAMPPITARDLEGALPDVTSTLTAAGLDAAVEIVRDKLGVPHIKAATRHDAFFAQGFVTAQDRLFHMDYDRMRALGRWAEWVGPSAVEQDKLMRKLGLKRAALADWNVTAPDAQAMVAAHTDGINFFLSSTAPLPVEYQLAGKGRPEKWEHWHTFALCKPCLMHICFLAASFSDLCRGSICWIGDLSRQDAEPPDGSPRHENLAGTVRHQARAGGEAARKHAPVRHQLPVAELVTVHTAAAGSGRPRFFSATRRGRWSPSLPTPHQG